MKTKQTGEKLHNYLWRGVNPRGIKETGEIEAASSRLARMLLSQKGIKAKSIRKESASLFGDKQIKNRDIVIFTRQLATLVESGIPLAEGMTAVGQSINKPAMRKLLSQMRRMIESGQPLSSVIRQHPKHFNELYIALITVGEESGTLGPMLSRISIYLEKTEALRLKIVSAMTYPLIVFILGLLIVSGLLIFIIPKFQDIFSQFGAELPALTQSIVNLSDLLQNYWYIILAGAVIAFMIYKNLYRRIPSIKLTTDKLILKIPVFGDLLNKSIIARISRTISIMFRAGIPIVETLGIIAPAAGNQVYVNAINQVRTDVSTGQPLAVSLTETGVFPSMVLQMVRTGEETGKMDAMLEKSADFYEEEVDNTVATISSLVEPILVVALGAMIGVVVVAMYLPIFNLGSVF